MNVYELKLKVYLLKDIKQEDALNQIAGYIDKTLSKNEDFLQMHQRNSFKNYSLSSLHPIAKQGIYKKDSVYTVVIRTIEMDLAAYFQQNLKDHYNTVMKGLTCELKIVPRRMFDTIYSLTPVLLKDSRGYWKQYMSFSEFEERLKVNLIKKYKAFSGNGIDEGFQLYTTIKILNKCPIKMPYKGVHLLGDKLELQVAENPIAQELIYMSLGTGLLESNARGYGFVNYQWYKEGKV